MWLIITDYVKRDIVKTLKAALNDMPVVVLTGMRQVGKSTLLRMQPEIRDRKYISLDDFAILETARGNPESLLAGDEPVSIDEAQKCPELLDAIKVSVDKNRVPGRFLLSGSANFSLLKGIAESLAGRAIYFNLHPMTRREISGGTSKQPFILKFFKDLRLPNGEHEPITMDEVLTGGMPSVCLGEITNPWLWFSFEPV